MRTDKERLLWLARSGAYMCFSKDGDDCWLRWPYGRYPHDEFTKAENQKGVFSSINAAIDAAMGEEK